MTTKSQADYEVFTKLQKAAANPQAAGTDQAASEMYKLLLDAGTSSPQKPGVSQSLAEQYHKLSGS